MQKIVRAVKLLMVLAVLLNLAGCYDFLSGGTVISSHIGQEAISAFIKVNKLLLVDTKTNNGKTENSYLAKSGFVITIITEPGKDVIAQIYDPLILQIPNKVTIRGGNFKSTDSEAVSGVLTVEKVDYVPVTPEISIFPEADHDLYIIDFPEGTITEQTNGEDREFEIDFYMFTPDITTQYEYQAKMISTGKVTVSDPETGDKTYYLPIYPAITDISQAPSINLGTFYGTMDKHAIIPPDLSTYPAPTSLSYDLTVPNRLYFSHTASDGYWETELSVINHNSSGTVVGSFKAYNLNGGRVGEDVNVTLNPHGRVEIIVGEAFSSPSEISYIVFSHNSDNSVEGYLKYYIPGIYQAAIPAVPEKDISDDDIYLTHIASNNEWWTGISLLNTLQTPTTLTIEFNTGDIKTVALAPKAKTVFTIESLFTESVPSGLSSAEIKNSSGIIALEVFGSTPASGKSYLSGVLLGNDTSKTMIYPHITTDTKWWTGIVAYNPQIGTANVTLTPYDQSGSQFDEVPISLAGNDKYIGLVTDLGLPENTAWFRLASDLPLSGFELFGTNNGQQLAGYSNFNIESTNGLFPKIKASGWTGIAFVNTSSTTNNVSLKAYTNEGNKIATAALVLAGNEKRVGFAESFFQEDISSATYISFDADADIGGFQINASSDGMRIDALPAL